MYISAVLALLTAHAPRTNFGIPDDTCQQRIILRPNADDFSVESCHIERPHICACGTAQTAVPHNARYAMIEV